MRKQDHLFYLIQSLSTAEKRYFKKFASLHGDGPKHYMELFDHMSNQSRPDDEQIHKTFKGSKFLHQLPVMKNYLKTLILKSLRSYGEKNSRSSELKELLRECMILLDRELYAPASTAIDKVIKLAEKYEKFEALLEAYRLKRHLLQLTKGVLKAGEEIQAILRQERTILHKIDAVNQLQELNYQLVDYEPGEGSMDFLKHPALAPDVKSTSLHAFTHAQHLIYAVSAFSGDLDGGMKALDDIIERMEQNPHRIREETGAYITVLNNKIGALLHARDLENIPGLLRKIRSIPATYQMRKDRIRIKTLLSTYNVELELYRDTHNWSEGVRTINELKAFLENNSGDVSAEHRITFYYQFAYIYFMIEDYSSALKYLNEISIGKLENVRMDIATYGRLLSLIIHYELGNVIVLRYAVESCRRFLKRRRQPQQFERVLLRFFGKISIRPRAEHHDLFVKLEYDLFAKTSDADRANILDYLDFKSWIDRKTKSVNS